jgi:hypothetical protein
MYEYINKEKKIKPWNFLKERSVATVQLQQGLQL